MLIEDFFLGAFVFIFGLLAGSFLNVCSYRLPREESVVWPGSHCPNCSAKIAWYDNIPLLSFVSLGGKCRGCKNRISFRYFFGELICGGLWLFLWTQYGFSHWFFAGIILFSILLTVTITDFETGLIPDKLSLPCMAAGLVLSTMFPEMQKEGIWYLGLRDSFLGLLAGGGVLFAVGWLGSLVFRKESMGGGDIKLLAAMGAFLGWQKAVFIFLLSPMLAMPFALYMKYVKKSETIPFGPFLALTGALFYLWGDLILAWIFSNYGVTYA